MVSTKTRAFFRDLSQSEEYRRLEGSGLPQYMIEDILREIKGYVRKTELNLRDHCANKGLESFRDAVVYQCKKRTPRLTDRIHECGVS
tara:strand:- start:222 stop:485 length:264 start_codon:yes stop_codon:yes gene_type:complete